MATQAIEVHRGGTEMLLADPARWETLKNLAAVMFAGGGAIGLVPACFRNAQQLQAGMLMALADGHDPLGAIQWMHPLPGNKIGYDYKFLLKTVEDRLPEWRWEQLESTDKVFRAKFQRSPKHPEYVFSYTIEQAKRAGLVKEGSAWVSHPEGQLRKTVLLHGMRFTAASAIMGAPRATFADSNVAFEMLDDADEVVDEQAKPRDAGEVLDAAAKRGEKPEPSGAEVVRTAEDAKRDFISAAVKRKFGKGSEAIYRLLTELLTVEGVVPAYASAALVPAQDWDLARKRLEEKYPDGKPEDWGKTAGKGTEPVKEVDPAGTDSAPEPATESEDAPPDAEGEAPTDAASDAIDVGESALIAQQSSYEYLLEVSRALELAHKAPETVVKQAPPASGKWWFVERNMLLAEGHARPDGSAQSKALFRSSNDVNNLEPHQVRALTLAVLERLSSAQASRRK